MIIIVYDIIKMSKNLSQFKLISPINHYKQFCLYNTDFTEIMGLTSLITVDKVMLLLKCV